MVKFNNSWDEYLSNEFSKGYYLALREFLKKEYATQIVYPDKYDIFNALKITDYNDVSVVILGQDPYHGVGQAHGLAFSVKPNIPIPPSLLNIYKELNHDLGCYIPTTGYLEKWAKQGVLLLNTVLTVRANMANSHSGKGWETFTNQIIKYLNDREKPIVFMLWGNNARSKKMFITSSNHLILETVHPSPLSAHNGFFGSKHFSICNKFLLKNNIKNINWQIDN